MREAKERELFEDDPAMSTSLSAHPPSASASAHKNRAKSRNVNGPERRNGSASTSGRERRPENRAYDDANVNGTFDGDRHGTWGEREDGCNPSRYGLDHSRSTPVNGMTSVPTRPPPSNGRHSTAPSRSGTITPALPREGAFGSRSPPRHYHDSRNSPQEEWTGQYAGPATGFLQGPAAPFGRVAQNPGRTIYSQQQRAD